jgi:hypothetical protein
MPSLQVSNARDGTDDQVMREDDNIPMPMPKFDLSRFPYVLGQAIPAPGAA